MKVCTHTDGKMRNAVTGNFGIHSSWYSNKTTRPHKTRQCHWPKLHIKINLVRSPAFRCYIICKYADTTNKHC